MLVYIRQSNTDEIICDIDDQNIAEHLKVSTLFVCTFLTAFCNMQSKAWACNYSYPDEVEERTGREGTGSSLHYYQGGWWFSSRYIISNS